MVYAPPIAFWGFDDAGANETYANASRGAAGRYGGGCAQLRSPNAGVTSVNMGPLTGLDVSSGGVGIAVRSTQNLKETGMDSNTYQVAGVAFTESLALRVFIGNSRVHLTSGSIQWTGTGVLESTPVIPDYLPGSNQWFYLELRWGLLSGGVGTADVRINGYQVLSGVTFTYTGDPKVNNFSASSIYRGLSEYAWLDDAYLMKSESGVPDWLGDLRVVQQYPAGPGSSTEWTPTPAGTPNWETVNEESTLTADYVSAAEGDLTDLYTPTPISGPWRIHGVKIETPARKNISGNAPDVRALNVLGAAEAEYPVQPPGNATWTNRGGSVQPLAPDGGEWTVAKLNATEFGVRSVAQ